MFYLPSPGSNTILQKTPKKCYVDRYPKNVAPISFEMVEMSRRGVELAS